MTKKELIESASLKSGLTKKDIELSLSALIESIEETVEKKEKVSLIGFGSFENVETKAISGVMNGKEWSKEAGRKPKFNAGQLFKDRIKNANI